MRFIVWIGCDSMEKRNELDLTTGNLFWKIPRFVLPFMMTTIFQLLYTSIDLWTVSKFGGKAESMSAIGSNSALINLIITVLVSLATGANVCISVAKGANDKQRASRILHTAFIVAVVGGVFVAAFGYFMTPFLLQLMSTPELIMERASTYLRIYFLGVPLLMIYNYGSQMLRALGDSKRPLYILMISGVLNVLFDLLFVIYAKMDVAGVAIATVISEGVSAALTLLWFIFNKKGFVRLQASQLRVSKEELKDILKIGLPAGLQGLAFCIPNVLIQSSLYSITNYSINGAFISQSEIVAGSAASAQVEGYVFACLDAFAVGLVSFVGQNYGAHNKANIRKVYWYSVTWMMLFWALCTVICTTMPYQLLSIFVTQSDNINAENALLAGRERLFLLVLTYCFDGLMGINGNYIRGMKRSTPPAIITLVGCTGTRILFLTTIFQMEAFHTVFWLYAAFPISWILVNIAYIPTVIYYERKAFDKINRYNEEFNLSA